MKKLLILFTFLVAFQLFAIRPIDKKLINAASEGNLQLVDQCIKDGADVNAKDELGNTSLIWASAGRRLNIVNNLLRTPGIDVNAKNNKGWTALIWASFRGHSNIVKELLQFPCIDVKDGYSNTRSLFMARLTNKEKIAQLIIDSKHFDIDKFLEFIPQKNEKEDWINYIYEQQKLIAEEKFKKLVQKHKSVTNYLEHRELCRLRQI